MPQSDEPAAFFALAESGAMGEPGSVYFYNKNGNLYYFNYARSGINMNKVRELFPALAICKLRVFGNDNNAPKGWNYMSLGMGNHLIINEIVYDEFIESLEDEYRPSKVYGMWMEIAERILESKLIFLEGRKQ